VTVKAYAFRAADDERPGIGHSSLNIPGSTSFTKGSEIENAETSAWGRAIAALGFEVKRGLASAEEVRNKQPESSRGAKASSPRGSAPVRTPEEQELLDELLAVSGMTHARLSLLADAVGVPTGVRATADQLREMLALTLESPEDASAHATPAGEDGAAPVLPTTPPAGSSVTAAATSPAESSPASPDSAPTLEDVLEVTGGELVPPEPGTDAYKALPAPEKAAARAWHQNHKEPARQTGEQMRAALTGGES
jgi:hypothetical protein